MDDQKYDIIIIGAGLVGLSSAYYAQKAFPGKRVLVLEKENTVAMHQSGHNSGVVHSGIYYAPGSLKAQNCLSGYSRLIDFARAHSIPFDKCGKIIVATAEDELPALQKIHERGSANGLKGLKMLSKEEIKEIEPHVHGTRALWVPQAGIIDYPMVAQRLMELVAGEQGGQVVFNEKVIALREDNLGVIVETAKKVYRASYVISCAGLHSDRVTALMDKSNDLRIIPFKGSYFQLKPEKEYLVKNLVYPVPDPKFPFLGVHFTRMINGGVEAGPNAVLSLKREGYESGSVSLKDTVATLTWPGFWKIAARYGGTGLEEMVRSVSKKSFTRALKKMVPEITEDDLLEGGAGIRAQACTRTGKLVDDFDFKIIGRTLHVRNAPSPAATSCLSIGESIVGKIKMLL